jgi:peptide chain release factor subunit 1
MAATASRSSSSGPDDGRLRRLTSIRPGRHQVVSCYLKLEPRDRSRGKYLIKVKNRVKQTVQALPRLGLDRETQDAVRRDLDRVQEFLRRPGNLPASQGLALFACEGLGLFEAMPLPAVYRSRLAVDSTPLVREVAAAEEEFGCVVTVVLDRTGARFFDVTAYDVVERPGLRADSTRGGRFHGDQNGPGWGEHAYNNRIREEKQRHFDAIARELFALDRQRPANGIVLAGPGTEAAAVAPFLHSYLTGRLLGTVKLIPKEATPAAVLEATLAVRASAARAAERAAVEEMREKIGSRWSVNGTMAVLRALARGQVRTLLVNADTAVPGFRCSDTGRLALAERDCRGEGTPVPVLDVIDEAIEEALRQHVAVNVVYEPAARAAIDGLAALLRFR